MDDIAKILVVDDEPFNIDYLEQELEDLGYSTLNASNGKEALDVIEAESPDMILLDIMMPVMDGFEVLKRLKAEPSWRDIPVVVISAMDDMDSIAKGIELGAEDYLPKPFEPILLHARLKAGLEKKRLRDLEQHYLQALERELEIGREIQRDFLPAEIIQPEGWEIAAAFQAAREVAGDFYDVFQLPGGRIGLILGDVCDKGVGSALYMALFRSLLRAASDPPSSTEYESDRTSDDYAILLNDAVQLVNDYICNVHASANYCTLFFGALDPASGDLSYIVAGHELPIVLRSSGEMMILNRTGPVVGLIEDAEFDVEEIQMETDDLLIVYSDGFPDLTNLEGEVFGKERFLNLIKLPSTSADSIVGEILKETSSFSTGTSQFDDMTMLAVLKQ
ncbi:MAG: SpoIIE family protein phosphatase [Anaerolineales bacterium]|nr:SpoIIE family protein phosphatase [Anaerolineales bacterium]